MKKELFVILALISTLFINSCKDNNIDSAAINGKFTNTTIKKVIVSYNENIDTVDLNSKGNFTAYLEIDKPQYINVEIGNNIINIYLTPKAKINFEADFKNINETIKFSGNNSDINNYIYKQNLTITNSGINPEKFPYNSSNNERYISSVENLAKDLNLNLNNLEKASGNKYNDFISSEKQRIVIIEAFLISVYYMQGITTEGPNAVMDAKLNEVLSRLDINNPKITEISEFKELAPLLAVYRLNQKILNDGLTLNSTSDFLNTYFDIIPEISESNEVLDEIYYIILTSFINQYGIESSNEAYQRYKDFSSNKERIDELERIRYEYVKLNPGMPSVEFSFPDINNKYYSLKDFKGKYLYIDIWASWCGPCRMEIPHLKALKEKFKNNNIEIIGISVDENKTQWENMVKSENLEGIQLYAGGWNNPLCNFFKIKGIPKFILLDKDGNIVNAEAPRPSGHIEDLLRSLKGI